jgi:hypothetical protein
VEEPTAMYVWIYFWSFEEKKKGLKQKFRGIPLRYSKFAIYRDNRFIAK